jgi:hypothetical protein
MVVRAYVYDIAVVDSAMDLAHNFTYKIRELYVPSVGIVANLGGNAGQIMVFRDHDKIRKKDGKNIRKITISESFVEMLVGSLRDGELEKELKRVLE